MVAALGTLVPAESCVTVPINGAYRVHRAHLAALGDRVFRVAASRGRGGPCVRDRDVFVRNARTTRVAKVHRLDEHQFI
jgi:hypothetical protein